MVVHQVITWYGHVETYYHCEGRTGRYKDGWIDVLCYYHMVLSTLEWVWWYQMFVIIFGAGGGY